MYAASTVLIMTGIRDITTSMQQGYAIDFDDNLYGWGANTIGDGSSDFWIYTPRFISGDVKNVLPGNMLLKNDNSPQIISS